LLYHTIKKRGRQNLRALIAAKSAAALLPSSTEGLFLFVFRHRSVFQGNPETYDDGRNQYDEWCIKY